MGHENFLEFLMSHKKFFPFLIFLVTFFKRLAQNAQTSHHFFHHIFSLIIPTVATSKKCFIKNLNLTDVESDEKLGRLV